MDPQIRIHNKMSLDPEHCCRTQWMIKNFPLLMEEPTDGADEDALVCPPFRVPIASFKDKSLEWTIKCWPNVSGKGMRLLIHLGRHPWVNKLTSIASTTKVRVAVAVKLLDSAGTKEDLGRVAAGRYDTAGSDVLNIYVPHVKLTSSADRYGLK
jgi:hypothetical protein